MSSIRSSSSAGDGHGQAAIQSDERTPLLTTLSPIPTNATIEASIQTAGGDGAHLEDEDAPLPYGQILILCFIRVVEPIAFFSIFPYIGFMIENVGGIDKQDVGFYAGLIESMFSAVQMCVMIFWGKAADKYGRKPCVVLSLIGTSTATALFGMSSTIWQMILLRCSAGLFSGTIVTVRTMISENSTKKTQARAFSYFSFAGNVGIFIGPFLGALLERPAMKFPSIFGRFQFFHDYPYALPSFVVASLGYATVIASVVFLRETLHIHHSNHNDVNRKPMSTMSLLKFPGVGKVLLVNFYIAALAFAYTAVLPVFLYTPVEIGGLGFSSNLIASVIGTNGISQSIWILLIFPAFHKRVGTGGVLGACALAWPFFFAMHPICHFFLKYDLKALFWSTGPLSLVIGSGVAMAFVSTQLAINDIAPSHETLGTLNAIQLAMSGGVRAVVPAIAASIFAAGIKYNIAARQLFWIVCIVQAMGLTFVLRNLPEKAGGRPIKASDEEEG